jgi:hypothetical protein
MPARRRSLKELADDPRFISGVYNYCDRWCERCPLTARCLVYATEQQDDADDPASRDIRNQAFWRRLEGMFLEAQEMLEEIMKEHGIEIDPSELAEVEQRDKRRHEETWSHPYAVAGNEYAKAVRAWFETAAMRFQERAEEIESHRRMELPGADPERNARLLQDATEVIQWYQRQIAVKIMRAVGSARRDEETDIELAHSDADGSAKVALIGMDRSLTAWSEILRQLPDEEDRILPLLAALSRLRRDIEATFPNARAFIRPGFDTGDAASRVEVARER